MTSAVRAGASAPAAGRRGTPTGRRILTVTVDRAPHPGLSHSQGVPA